MRRGKKTAPKNLKMAGWFSLAVITLIFLSVVLKFIILVEESRFDGTSHFTLEVANKNEFVSFSPKDSSINILKVEGEGDIAKTLEIPVDAKINSEKELAKENLSGELLKLSLNLRREINFLDVLRLLFFSTSVRESSFNERTISLSDNKSKIQSALALTLSDPGILEEKQSIEIINASDVPGLGNRLANYITNTGANVILVTTGDNSDTSLIKYSTKSYTQKKLADLLGFKTKMDKKDLADVIIIIGKDSAASSRF